jgi:hypothetical protein
MQIHSYSTLNRMSARDIKAHLTGMAGWKAYRLAHNVTTANMSKSDMIDAVIILQGVSNPPLINPPAPAPIVTPDPLLQAVEDWVASGAQPSSQIHHVAQEAGVSEAEAAEALAVAATGVDPLASLRGVLSPSLLAEADTAIGALLASTAAAAQEASEAKAQAERALAALAQAQGTTVTATRTIPGPKPTTFLAPVGTRSLAKVMGTRGAGKYTDIQVPVYASPDAPAIDPDYLWPEGSSVLLAALARSEHVFIFGDAGTGKTTFGEQVAARCGRPYFAISFTGEKASYDLIGQPEPDGMGGMAWRDGELLAAMQVPGALISLEELGFARSELVSALLSALQGGFVNLPGRRVDVAPGVVFDGRCPGLNPAVAGLMVDFRRHVSAAVARGEAEHGVTIRRLLAWGRQVAAGLPSADGFLVSVLNASPIDDREYYQQQASAMLPHDRIDAAQAGTGSLTDTTAPVPAEPGQVMPPL